MRVPVIALALLTLSCGVVSAASLEFDSREAAAAAAAGLRDGGAEVSIQEFSEMRYGNLHNVQLRGFSRWSDVQQALNRLRERGIESHVFSLPQERGYAIDAGLFRDVDRAEEVMYDILDAGYREVYLLRLPEEVTLWRVVERTADGAHRPATRGGVLRFGDDTAQGRPARSATPGRRFRTGVDTLHLEAGWLTDSDSAVDSSNYLRADISTDIDLAPEWEIRASARIYGWHQSGDPDYRRGDVDYGDSWLRWRGDDLRLTVGAQTVVWGRVDEIPPTDRLSVHDVSRFALDNLSDRRRSVPAVRLEQFHGNFKTDLLWMPWFRGAELPHRDSIWHPVDRQAGRLIGLTPDPLLAGLVAGASFDEDDDGHGGIGVRLSHAGRGVDYALTLQNARHSLPYYELDPSVRDALLATGDPAAAIAAGERPATFTARHPRTTVIGGDVGVAIGSSTWRFEAAWLSDVPVTTRDLRMETVRGIDWVAGVEFYPGDADTRVNLQLAAQHLVSPPDILDRHGIYAVNGEVEMIFANYRWRGRLRYSIGLDAHDVYLNPELAWIAREPHVYYLAWHYLDGDDDTPGGFFAANDLLTLGWRASF